MPYQKKWVADKSPIKVMEKSRQIGITLCDEFAFHSGAAELLKEAIALTKLGGLVHIISTHNGTDSAFNQLIEEIKVGKRPYPQYRITFDDAIDFGLYKKICLVRSIKWSQKLETEWRQEMIDRYGADADEELFCNPKPRK